MAIEDQREYDPFVLVAGEAQQVTRLAVPAGHTAVAAELARAILDDQVDGTNARVEEFIDRNLNLDGVREHFEVFDDATPLRMGVEPEQVELGYSLSGVFKGYRVFDRSDLRANDGIRTLPWSDRGEDRLEVCVALEAADRLYLVPVNKIESGKFEDSEQHITPSLKAPEGLSDMHKRQRLMSGRLNEVYPFDDEMTEAERDRVDRDRQSYVFTARWAHMTLPELEAQWLQTHDELPY